MGEYDVFIAYYGDLINGTQRQAEAVYDFLQSKMLRNGHCINAYCHPKTNPYGQFEETPNVIINTRLFLLVADRNIPRDKSGQLIKYKGETAETQTLSHIYEEVQAFHNSGYRKYNGDKAAKLLLVDKFDFDEAKCIHSIFSGTVALRTCEQVYEWINDFICGSTQSVARPIFDDSFIESVKKLSESPSGFMLGNWVEKAERIWEENTGGPNKNLITQYEDLGRCLLVYYHRKPLYQQGRLTASEKAHLSSKIRSVRSRLLQFPTLQSKTRALLSAIDEENI